MFIESEIIRLILVVFSLFGYCFLFKKNFNQQLGFSLVFTISAISVLLFFSSLIFGDIYYLAKFFHFFGLALFIYILVKIFFNKSQNQYQINYDLALETFLSPLFILFVLISIYCFDLFKGSYYSGWDEFSHWGIAAKELFIKNRLFEFIDLKNNFTADRFYNYPPSSILAQYYITKNTSAEFYENLSLVANAIILAIPLFYCLALFELKEKKLKNWLINFLLYLAIFIFFKVYLVSFYFYLIFVDVLLGLYFGVLLSIILLYKKETKVDFIFFISSLFFISFFIVAIKHSGFFLCLLALPLIFISKNSFSNISKNKYLILFLQISAILLAIFLAKYLWLQNVDAEKYAMIQDENKFDIFNLSKNQLIIINNFLEKSLQYFILSKLLVIKFILLFLAFLYLHNLFILKNNKKTIAILSLYILGVYLLYLIGLLIMYLTQMPEFDVLKLASYNRYLYTIITAISLFLFAILAKNLSTKFLLRSFIVAIFAIFILTIQITIPTNHGLNTRFLKKDLVTPSEMMHTTIIRQPAKDDINFINNLNLTVDQKSKIMVLFHNFIYPECNYFKYEISPHYSQSSSNLCEMMLQKQFVENIQDVKNQVFKLKSAKKALYYYPFANKYVEIDFIETAKKHDFLFIPRADKELWKLIGKYFSGENYQDNKFFFYDKKLDKFVVYKK